MIGRREWSIRALLVAIIAVATAPPIVIGFWQIRSAGTVGRSLLTSQLDRQLDELASAVHARWSYRQGNLLLLAGNDVTRAVLSAADPAEQDLAFVRDLATRSDGVEQATLVGRAHDPTLLAGEADALGMTGPSSGALPVIVPVVDDHGAPLGELRARIALTKILPAETRYSITTPPMVAVFDSGGRVPLATPSVPADLLRGDTFVWTEQHWLVRRRVLAEPPLSLVLAAPLDPFVTPFQRAAAERTAWLVAGSIIALVLSSLLASRLTTSVQRLAVAADAIADGNLGKRIVGNGTVEVGRLARSFNAMTSALEETLRQLAQRASLAAVGEFAASLAHEIRNPLTAIRVDLQHLARHAKPDVAEREALDRALRQVDRLDRAVSAALELARGGAVRLTPTVLAPVIRDAVAAAGPEAVKRNARVTYASADAPTISVLGDAGALHQLLLNLVLNAIQAVEDGGTVRVESARERDRVIVTIADDGRGIPSDQLSRVFDPFYTTKSGGTGLGLAVARRITISLGGEITLRSGESRGTIATVVLRASEAAGPDGS